jgi:hypothetical protein
MLQVLCGKTDMSSNLRLAGRTCALSVLACRPALAHEKGKDCRQRWRQVHQVVFTCVLCGLGQNIRVGNQTHRSITLHGSGADMALWSTVWRKFWLLHSGLCAPM